MRGRTFLPAALVILVSFPIVALSAAQKPITFAELALYKGADRQKILVEGAKKEGKLTLYTSAHETQAVRPLIQAFEKKYPFLKVHSWRGETKAMFSRISEEYGANQHVVDVVEGTEGTHMLLQKANLVQPYYSPELAKIDPESITMAPNGGALAASTRASGIGVGYNTKLIKPNQLPKSYQDLLDPKWKDKLVIAGSSTGTSWCWLMYKMYGEDFVRRLAKQNISVQMVSARSLMDLIIAGEYAFSPTSFDSHVVESKKSGAPVEWIPTEPVHVNLGQIALPKDPPSPYAALLLADFELAKVNGEILKRAGYQSFRKDVTPLTRPYKKFYGVESTDELKKSNDLFNELFLKK